AEPAAARPGAWPAAQRHTCGPRHLRDRRTGPLYDPFVTRFRLTPRACNEMGPARAHAERIIAELAGRQRGVVTASQLRAAGFDAQAVKRRLRSGRLHRLHRGVYLVGHRVAPEGAAELAA